MSSLFSARFQTAFMSQRMECARLMELPIHDPTISTYRQCDGGAPHAMPRRCVAAAMAAAVLFGLAGWGMGLYHHKAQHDAALWTAPPTIATVRPIGYAPWVTPVCIGALCAPPSACLSTLATVGAQGGGPGQRGTVRGSVCTAPLYREGGAKFHTPDLREGHLRTWATEHLHSPTSSCKISTLGSGLEGAGTSVQHEVRTQCGHAP